MVVACFAMSIQLALLPPSNTPQIRLQESHPLVRLTAALDWEELVAEVEKIRATKVSSPGGRRPHLRALVGAVVLMSVRQMPYRELEDQIRHYGPARYLCGLSDSLWTPDFTTIHDFSQLLGAEGLRRLNEFVVRMAHAEGFVDPSLCVADTTAQEAPMSYPTEVGLIGTFFKRVTCLGKKSGRSVSPRLEKNRTQKPSAKPRVSRQALAS